MVTLEDKESIERNIPLVHSIAARFRGRGIEYDDLFQAGCLGLIKAFNNFDESRGFAFSTYAVPVIMGEIRLLFRDGGAVKVSRSLRDKSIKASRIREAFLNREQREPTVSELAGELCCDINEAAEVLNLLSPILSIEGAGEDGAQTLDIPVDDSEALFNRLSVLQLLDKLEAEERQLVILRYYKGLTQTKTAEQLNISQVQVSRKEKRILHKLRNLYYG